MKMVKSGPKYRDEILKMMFVAGETSQPDVETTTMVENIVRDQTMHTLAIASKLAARRGQTKFTIDDIIFQVRNDAERLARLRNHMQWKQIRKRARVKDDEAADDLDQNDVDDIIEDEGGDGDAEASGAAEPNSDPATPQSRRDGTEVMASGPEVSIPPLPWSILSMFPHATDIPSLATMDNGDRIGGGNLGPSFDSTTSRWLLARLIKNDERTRVMTAEEYSVWSECRSASFTHRKKKTFREWCGLGVITDHRAKDDVLEILGFLTSEWVRTLTERALEAQRREIKESAGDNDRAGMKRKYNDGPFAMRDGEGWELRIDTSDESVSKSPIQIRHVRRGFEMLQKPPKRYTVMLNRSQSRQQKKMKIF